MSHIRFIPRPSFRFLLSALLGFLIGSVLVVAAAYGALINCGGGFCGGTNNDDVIVGTNGYDNINARSGSDESSARDSGDDMGGDHGNDFLDGEGGYDNIYGEETGDRRVCNPGNYYCALEGHGGNDTIEGNAGDDVLRGWEGADSHRGGPDLDIIDSQNDGQGGDFVDGGSGKDACYANLNDYVLNCEGPS